MISTFLYSQYVSTTNKESINRSMLFLLLPILQGLYQRKSIDSLGLFITNDEVKYLEDNHPEFNMLIANLSKMHRLSLMTGTYHNVNPMLFPARNIAEDIEHMTTMLRRQYGKRPSVFFPYASVWAPNLVGALKDCGIKDVIFPALEKIDFSPEGAFEVNELLKSVTIHHADKEITEILNLYIKSQHTSTAALSLIERYLEVHKDKDIIVGLDLDNLSKRESAVSFVNSLLKMIQNINKESVFLPVEKNPRYPQFFLPSGCYSNVYPKLNILGDILLNDDSLYLARVRYVKDILLRTDLKKGNLGDKKYLQALMYSISGLSHSFPDYTDEAFYEKSTRDFYTIISSLYDSNLITPQFMTSRGMCSLLTNKNLVSLISNEGNLLELGLTEKGVAAISAKDEIKDYFVTEKDFVHKIECPYEVEYIGKNNIDVKYSTLCSGLEISKEVHISTSSIVINISIKNVQKKNISLRYEQSLSLACLHLGDKKPPETISNLRMHVNSTNDTIVFSSSKAWRSDHGLGDEYIQNKKNKLLIKPSWDVKLKKGEAFDLNLTFRYEKQQEVKK